MGYLGYNSDTGGLKKCCCCDPSTFDGTSCPLQLVSSGWGGSFGAYACSVLNHTFNLTWSVAHNAWIDWLSDPNIPGALFATVSVTASGLLDCAGAPLSAGTKWTINYGNFGTSLIVAGYVFNAFGENCCLTPGSKPVTICNSLAGSGCGVRGSAVLIG